MARIKQTQFTPTRSTPDTLQTRKAVPPSWTVVLCAIIWKEILAKRNTKATNFFFFFVF